MTAAGSQITILIPDPDEMMFVAGDHEANIDRIEREFGVKIVSRGAELRISVEAPAVALNVNGSLEAFYRGGDNQLWYFGIH